MSEVVFKMQGTDGVISVMGAVGKSGVDFRPIWPKAHTIINRATARQFRTKGKYMGADWKPLTTKYKKWKQKRYPGKPIERRTDRMWKSLTNPNDQEHIFIPRRQSVDVGSINPIAPIQHSGAPSNNLPARRLMGYTKKEVDAIMKLVQKNLFSDIGGVRRISLEEARRAI